MKSLLLIMALLASACVFGQTYHVTLRPHNGQENDPFFIDSICSGEFQQDSVQDNHLDFSALCWTYNGCLGIERHLIRFAGLSDTSVIPRSAHIVSATLRLYGEAPNTGDDNYGNSYYSGSPFGNTNESWLYELTDSFDAHTVTWNTQPDIKHTDSVAIPLSTSQWGGMVSLNVTSLVADEFVHGNTGFKMMLQTEEFYRQRLFASSYYPDTNYHPALDIIYTDTVHADTSAGVSNVSNIVSGISLYPNPLTTQLNMQVALTTETDLIFKIYNVTGTLMDFQNVTAKKGLNYYSVATINWPQGVYFLVLSDGVSTTERKFVKN